MPSVPGLMVSPPLASPPDVMSCNLVPERLPPRGPQAAQEAPRAPAAPERGPGQFDLFSPRLRAQIAVAQPRIYTVGELTREVKGVLEGRFPALHVRGEVSNLRRPSSGHLYFTLKDTDACIGAVLFAREARRLRFSVQNGLSVLVRGRMSLYEPQGQYQLICDSIEPLGAGALQVAFEQLKARLEAEGLFDSARKRSLPFLPARIAVVTSPAGAAVHDFLRVLHRRFPNLPVLIVPARVQGDGAAQEIARGIVRGAGARGVDVLVIARGGGSLEDLWPFNEEVVARALAACPVPTVSAVGHEVDFTIADFAADVRAPTPTAAAELLARVKEELVADLATRRARLLRSFRALAEKRQAQLAARRARIADPRRLIGERKLSLDKLQQRLEAKLREDAGERVQQVQALRDRLQAAHPAAVLHRLHKDVARLEERLKYLARRALAARRHRFEGLAGRLDALSPLRVLARGYAVAFDERGHALLRAGDVRPGEQIRVRLHRGELEAGVTRVAPPDDEEI
jgi:exodeoxyribonuclease VII large subunit